MRSNILLNMTLCLSLAALLCSGAARAQSEVVPATPEEVLEVDLSALEPGVATQLEAAQRLLQQSLQGETYNPQELATQYGELGRLYLAYELHAPAVAAFSEAIQLDPGDYRYPYHLGYALEREGDLQRALDTYRKALLLRPDIVPLRVREVRLLRRLGRIEEAKARLEEIITAEISARPGLAMLFAERGEISQELGETPRAVDDLEMALRIVPEAGRLHYPLALAYRSLGELEKARQHMAQRNEVGLRYPDPMLDDIALLATGERAYLLRGQLAFRAGDIGAAIEAFQLAVQGNPQSVPARVDLGTALAYAGRHAQAMEQFVQVLEIMPDNATANYNMALLLMREKRDTEALEYLSTAARLASTDAAVQLAYARLLGRLGDTAAAIEQYKRSVRLAPDNPDIWLEGAELLLDADQFDESHMLLEQANARLPADGRIAHRLARLLSTDPELSRRDGTRALDLARKVFDAHPSTEHARTLAYALAESGRCEEAAAMQTEVYLFLQESGAAPELLQEIDQQRQHFLRMRPCRP